MGGDVKGKLIAFEGLDASGKSTQIRLLLKALRERKIRHECIGFPRTREPGYGEAIAMFLRGELGSVDEVNPYLIAGLYAGDRATARPHLEERLKAGYLVIADRYTYSNLAFQGAKIADPAAKRRFSCLAAAAGIREHWAAGAGVGHFFRRPARICPGQALGEAIGRAAELSQGKPDIHESVARSAGESCARIPRVCRRRPEFIAISLASGRSIPDIHREMMQTLEARGIVPG